MPDARFRACCRNEWIWDSKIAPNTFGNSSRSIDTATACDPFPSAMASAISWDVVSHFLYTFRGFFLSQRVAQSFFNQLRHNEPCKSFNIEGAPWSTNRTSGGRLRRNGNRIDHTHDDAFAEIRQSGTPCSSSKALHSSLMGNDTKISTPRPPCKLPGARRSPGWGGRRSPSDGLPGGGGIARVFQGKLWYPPLMQAKRTRVKRLSR